MYYKPILRITSWVKNHGAATLLLVLALSSGLIGRASAIRPEEGPCGGPYDCWNPNCVNNDICGSLGTDCENYSGCCNIVSYWSTFCFGCPGYYATGYTVDAFEEVEGKPCAGSRCTTYTFYVCQNGW
jgi:hypothetical protein